MEVLFVNHCLSGGGSERAMTLIANAFAKRGHDVEMALLSEAPVTYETDKRIRIVKCYCPMKGNKIIWHIRRIRSIRKMLKAAKAKTVITFMWDINMNVILASFGLGKRIIASERNDPHNETRRLMKYAMKFILPFAYHTVFQTPLAQSYYPISVQRKSTVIPNAVNVKERASDRLTVRKEVAAVGRLVRQKNFRLLIQAFAEFHISYPDYHLVIYGDGPLKQELEEQTEKLGLKECVVLCGYVSDVTEKIKNAAMYVNSSDYEGISNAMLEAMALGLPCICTDCPVGGAAMVIQDGVNGVLVPVGNAEKMSEAMCRIAKETSFAKALGLEAEKVKEIYSVDVIAEKWMELCY